MKRVLFVSLLLLLALIAGCGQRIVTVEGKVSDSQTGDPITGAVVKIGDREVKTGAEGEYKIEIPVGSYTLKARASGYSSYTSQIDIKKGVQEVEINIQLTPAPPPPPKPPAPPSPELVKEYFQYAVKAINNALPEGVEPSEDQIAQAQTGASAALESLFLDNPQIFQKAMELLEEKGIDTSKASDIEIARTAAGYIINHIEDEDIIEYVVQELGLSREFLEDTVIPAFKRIQWQ